MRKTKLRKKTINETEILRKECVELAKTIVKIIASYKCDYCGKSKPNVSIHAHHIYNEGVHRTMSADLDNIISVCFTHHNSDWNAKEPSFHRNPQEMADWFREKYPERAKILRERAKSNQQADRQFWENKYKQLQDEFQRFNNLCERNNGEEKSAGVPF